MFRRIGITFALMCRPLSRTDDDPVDGLPRMITPPGMETPCAAGWSSVVRTLNAYLKDIYGAREILRAGSFPRTWCFQNPRVPARR